MTIKRSYEVSIWTLQDEFITVLKPSELETKNNVHKDAKMSSKDDGTLELTYSLPMYIYEEGERKENPIWYNTKNGVIVKNIRKLKVIFNKNTAAEAVYEFLIVDVKESHDKDQVYCDIQGEGLVFNELGKIGYKIELSAEEFLGRTNDFFDNGKWIDGRKIEHTDAAPFGNIQYWLNEFLEELPTGENAVIDPTKWYYKIEMDWSSYGKCDGQERASNKIYEEEYVGSWQITNGKYTPKSIEAAQEKERTGVDIRESNIYNITQELAKAFGVFCRYEYLYDDNYHIIGRLIIFYNSFIKEKEGYLELTYPYTLNQVEREIDSKDVSTKMFVKAVENENSESNLITILDVEANKTGEDYLLNFDYLYESGNITEEQKQAIAEFEVNIGEINKKLKNIDVPLTILYGKVPELEANVTFYTNAISLDTDRLNDARALYAALDIVDEQADGYIEVPPNNPNSSILIKDPQSSTYYVNIHDVGVDQNSLQIYQGYDFGKATPKEELKLQGSVHFDPSTGQLDRVENITPKRTDSYTVYLTYRYSPKLQYDKVIQTWQIRQNKDTINRDKAQEDLDNANELIKKYQEQYNELLLEKAQLIEKFERMMGPAIRESYWQPDDYKDRGDQYEDILSFDGTHTQGISDYTSVIWDNKLFDGEQDCKYEIGAEQTIAYYPCIKLSNFLNTTSSFEEETINFLDNLDKISFMYYVTPNSGDQDITKRKTYTANSTAQYCWIRHNDNELGDQLIPCLLLTGADTITSAETSMIQNSDYAPQLAVINYYTEETTVEGVTNVELEEKIFSFGEVSSSDNWLTLTSADEIVYPRIKVSSMDFKENELKVKFNEQVLEKYKDYSVLVRDDSQIPDFSSEEEENDEQEIIYDAAYYITLTHPEILFDGENEETGLSNKNLILKFALSNASTEIYLDALQVLKENAYPKLTYSMSPSTLRPNLSYDLYKRLGYICNINDVDLKLENVQGYISGLELDLNNQQNDKIEIKNYRAKFEDLFSNIVAQTQQMQKNAYVIGLAANTINNNGEIDASVLQDSINRADLDYAFNHGDLTIDNENGIWAKSEDGIVAMRGGGIFTASVKDADGNWKWNTGILPQGINADLITTGRLDTNLIKIYGGDKVRLQMNKDGLFAYKSVFDDSELMSAAEIDSNIEGTIETNTDAGLDKKQYVVHNENGLFLIAEKNAIVLDNSGNTPLLRNITTDVKRVEVSWDGLILRNWDNKKVFFANPNNGDLVLEGTIYAKNLYIGEREETPIDITNIGDSVSSVENDINGINNSINGINNSIGGINDSIGGLSSGIDSINDSIDSLTSVITNKNNIFYSATTPTNYNKGDIWYDTVHEKEYIAQASTASLNDWVLIKVHAINGTNLTVDTDSGEINLISANTISLASNILTISGNAGISIGSGNYIKLASADANFFSLTSSGIELDSNAGISLTGGVISLTGSSINLNSTSNISLIASEDQPIASFVQFIASWKEDNTYPTTIYFKDTDVSSGDPSSEWTNVEDHNQDIYCYIDENDVTNNKFYFYAYDAEANENYNPWQLIEDSNICNILEDFPSLVTITNKQIKIYIQNTEPQESQNKSEFSPQNGDLWLDTSNDALNLNKYYNDIDDWVFMQFKPNSLDLNENGLSLIGSNINLQGGIINLSGSNGGQIYFSDDNNKMLFAINGEDVYCKTLRVDNLIITENMTQIIPPSQPGTTITWEYQYDKKRNQYRFLYSAINSSNTPLDANTLYSLTITVDVRNGSTTAGDMYINVYNDSHRIVQNMVAKNVKVSGNRWGTATTTIDYTTSDSIENIWDNLNIQILKNTQAVGSVDFIRDVNRISNLTLEFIPINTIPTTP